MKKAILVLCLIAACAALCAAAWTGHHPCDEVPLTAEKTVVSAVLPPTPLKLPHETEAGSTISDTSPIEPEISCEESASASAVPLPRENAPAEDCTEIPCNVTAKTEPNAASNSAPYHTDVYPDNIYSEEYEYDENGKLKSKTTTYPCDFSASNFIWIDGRAYADVPGFGLVEWGGPNRVTVCYDMYENGNEVGIMGGGETPQPIANVNVPYEEPVGEIIYQELQPTPTKDSTPPDYIP